MTETFTESADPGPEPQRGGGRRGVLTAAVLGAAGLGIAGAAKALSMGTTSPDAAASVTGTSKPTTTPKGASGSSPSPSPAASSATPSLVSPSGSRTSGSDVIDINDSFQKAGKKTSSTTQHLTYTEIVVPQTPAPATSSTSAAATATAVATATATATASATSTATASATSALPSSSQTPSLTASPTTSATAASVSPSTSATAQGSTGQPTTSTPSPTTTAPPIVVGAFSAAANKAVQAATVFGAAGPLTAAQANAHLLRRATWGARPGDRTDLVAAGIDPWLESQLNPTTIADPVGDAIAAQFLTGGTSIAQVIKTYPQYSWDACFEVGSQALARQIYSKRQLFEVVVDTLANLLNVTIPSDSVWATGADWHYQVIRKHAFGKYRDMLLAAMKHPAMLTYLNNNESERTHVNENLGRELLELHTLGVTGGYTEDDVKNAAKILSGRTIEWDDTKATYQQYKYNRYQHYVGAVKVMGFTDPNTDDTAGEALCDRFLVYLSGLRPTAVRVARKLALRFVSDAPSDTLVNAMADAYLANDTQIVPMLRTMFASVEFWSSVGAKTKRPTQDFISSLRALDVPTTSTAKDAFMNWMYWEFRNLGDGPFGRVPPDGYPDVAAAWQSSGQVLQRWSMHRKFTNGWYGLKPTTFPWKPPAGLTLGQWLDQQSQLILGGFLPVSARAAIIEYVGAAETSAANFWSTQARGTSMAALILDSIYFEAR